MEESFTEITENKDRFLFKKVGFVYPGLSSFNEDLGFCVKNKKLTISGNLTLCKKSEKIIISFQKKNRYKRVFGLDESSEIEVSEERIIFGYQYEISIPKTSITLLKK